MQTDDFLEINNMNLPLWLMKHPEWIGVPVSMKARIWVELQAAKRDLHGNKNGWRSKTDGSSAPYHLAGVAGEWACVHAFGLKYGRTIGNSRAELNQGDLFDSQNRPVEVKAPRGTRSNQWDLIENLEKLTNFEENQERIYINCLTAGWPNAVIIIGWAYGVDILNGRRARHGKAGHQVCILDWPKLHSPKTLFDELGINKPIWIKNQNPNKEKCNAKNTTA